MIAGSRTKKFITPFGEFVFYPLQTKEYEFLTGVTRIEEIKGKPYLIASPLRALTDYVYIKKIDWQGLDFLTSGMRIDLEHLTKIDTPHFLEIKKVYQSKRVLHFIDRLKQELKK
jgi:hypothetical protein